MIRHAGRAVPWGLVALGCTLVPALIAVAAWSMDERAAAVVDTLPRPLWWRTAARAAACVPLAVVWIACVALAGDRLPDHRGLFVLQGVTAMVVAVAFVTWRRSRGSATPGARIAPGAAALVTMLALVRPAPEYLVLFPIWPWERWGLSAAIWSALLAGGAVLLAASLRAGSRPTPTGAVDFAGPRVSSG